MPEANCEQMRACIYCGRDFSLKDVQWLISDQTKDFFAQDPELRNARMRFEQAMNGFLCLDTKGSAFCNSMGGKGSAPIKTQKVRLVTPEDLAAAPEGKGRNLYQQSGGDAASIFYRLDPEDPAYPGLRFTDEFVEQIDQGGELNLKDAKADVERYAIRPVCPHCTSYLPELLLSRDSSVRVVRLGLIGPADSGKTTLNMVNLVCGCLNCGGWVAGASGISAPSHYLLDNCCKSMLSGNRISQTMPRGDSGYLPPLLVQMEHGSKRVLLVLADIPAKVLQAVRTAILENAHTPQTICCLRLLHQLDGCLLLLDARQEILPAFNVAAVSDGGEQENQGGLESLIQIFSGLQGWQRKPAALLISKCHWLFDNGKVASEKLDELFSSFSSVDKVLWQQPKETGAYSADRQEALQYSFKPLVRKLFPTLWIYLEKYFSRIDIFPQSSWGVRPASLDADEELDPSKMKPFYSGEPIIWLLNMIR